MSPIAATGIPRDIYHQDGLGKTQEEKGKIATGVSRILPGKKRTGMSGSGGVVDHGPKKRRGRPGEERVTKY